jgi:hypothetical protein
MGNDNRKTLNISLDTYNQYFLKVARYGESADDIIKRLSLHYIRTTHKNNDGKFDGKGVR